MSAAPVGADKAHRVGVIHHHQRLILVRQIANPFQVGNHAVHREYAVGGDQDVARAVGFGLLQLCGSSVMSLLA